MNVWPDWTPETESPRGWFWPGLLLGLAIGMGVALWVMW